MSEAIDDEADIKLTETMKAINTIAGCWGGKEVAAEDAATIAQTFLLLRELINIARLRRLKRKFIVSEKWMDKTKKFYKEF